MHTNYFEDEAKRCPTYFGMGESKRGKVMNPSIQSCEESDMATTTTVINKFFTNKIQSTETSWPAYLLEIADVFSRFDGAPYDRNAIIEEFQNISSRGPYVVRDPSDFRDEYSAYASFLGLAYVARDGNDWVTRLTEAARVYLCSTEPDTGAFCRVQLSLFQYPAGVGVTYAPTGRPSRVQSNALKDTKNQVAAGVRLVPLRVILKAMLAIIDRGQDPSETALSFSTIHRMFNSPAVFQTPTPSNESLLDVADKSKGLSGISGTNLGYFKRNFHILEQTGLLRRTVNRNAIQLELGESEQSAKWTLSICRAIADSEIFYNGFENCVNAADPEECIRDAILDLRWGSYFDGGNLPRNLLNQIEGIPTSVGEISVTLPGQPNTLRIPSFPPLTTYNPTPANPSPSPLTGTGVHANPEHTRVLREKANRSHARIVNLLSSTAKAQGYDPTDNEYIDLCLRAVPLIIEVKSCNDGNMLSQIRRGVSQLYEYRFRSGIHDAQLCLALEQEPSGQEAWLVRYLLEDRQIYPLWVVGDVNLDAPPDTKTALAFLFP